MVRKTLLFLFFWIGATTLSQAQISHGGTPISSGSHFKSLASQDQELSTIVLTKPNLKSLDPQEVSNLFALAIPVQFNLHNSGKWTQLSNGDHLWRLKLKVEDALSLRAIFDQFWLPLGARLFLYDPSQKEVLGSFTSANNKSNGWFGTDLIRGEELVIEYYEPAPVKGQGKLSLWRVDYGFKAPEPNDNLEKAGGMLSFGSSGACNININCNQGNEWQDEKRGIVNIILTSVNGSAWCSGSLINNTAQDDRPLLLSAFHCGEPSLSDFDEGFVENSWVFLFNYEAPDCVNPSTEPLRQQSIAGCDVLARSEINADFLLLELSSEIPVEYDAYFNGWDRNGANTNDVVSIHHPQGDIKKISRSSNTTTTTLYADDQINTNGTDFRIVWTEGTTERGSSGSPLFSPEGLIIGQLHGGDASCSISDGPDWYGKIESSWTGDGSVETSLASWLDPGSTGVSSLAGKSIERLNDDVAISNIIFNTSLCDFSANTPLQIQVANRGFNAQSNLLVKYELLRADSSVFAEGQQSIAQLGFSESVSLDFTLDLSQYEGVLQLVARLDNFSDEKASNDEKRLDLPELVTSFPYIEDFEQGAGSWTIGSLRNNESGSWELGIPSGEKISRAASGANAWVTNLDGSYDNRESSFLLSPYFDFSRATEIELTANIFIDLEEDFDGAQVQVSTDCGLSWTRLGDLGTGENWYDNDNARLSFDAEFGDIAWSSETDQDWKVARHPLEAYAGNANVRFRVLMLTDLTEIREGMGFDNVSIRAGRIDGVVTSLESFDQQEVLVFPNPAQAFIKLKAQNGNFSNELVRIKLYNHLGMLQKEVDARLIPDAEMEINLEGLSPGIYLLRISGDQGESIRKVIIH